MQLRCVESCLLDAQTALLHCDAQAAILVSATICAHARDRHADSHMQAAIVALNLVGRPLSTRNGLLSAAIPSPAKSPSTLGHPILGPVLLPAVEDTSDLDGKTAAEVLDLEAKKRQAVVREDYDEAKELKRTADRLRSFGRRIAELESKCVAWLIHCWSQCYDSCWLQAKLWNQHSSAGPLPACSHLAYRACTCT